MQAGEFVWDQLQEAVLAHNSLHALDHSLSLLPKLKVGVNKCVVEVFVASQLKVSLLVDLGLFISSSLLSLYKPYFSGFIGLKILVDSKFTFERHIRSISHQLLRKLFYV